MLLQKGNKFFNKKDNLAKLEIILSQENYLEVLEKIFLIKIGDLVLELTGLDDSFDRKDKEIAQLKEKELLAIKIVQRCFVGQRKEIERLSKLQEKLEGDNWDE